LIQSKFCLRLVYQGDRIVVATGETQTTAEAIARKLGIT
jgi:phosphoserine phosphatase